MVDMEKLVKEIKSIVCEDCCGGGYAECKYDVCGMHTAYKVLEEYKEEEQ